ncbi:MAG: SelT/SelW/SelH family protein, partial [Dehalococcoidia bacterium]
DTITLMATNPINPEATARVEIEYCAQCGFLPRATWLAQELLNTFALELRELALVPGKGGILEVRVDGEVVYNRQDSEGFVDPKQVKQAIRDRIAPGRALGHSEGRGKGE